jgi:heterodisulfide reductase subunit A
VLLVHPEAGDPRHAFRAGDDLPQRYPLVRQDFERFYQRAEKLPGVKFIRSYVSIGREIAESKNVTIRYSTTDEGVKEEEFNLVVLSVGLNPPADAKELASKFGIELGPQGFCKTNPSNPIETTRPGVFISGAFQGPLDIPESVVTASAAGALSAQLLKSRRGRLSRERVYPEEKDVSKEEAKVGVFVCRCGANIGRVVDVPSLVEYSKTLGNVAHAEESLFACATNTAQAISDTIRDKGLNRVVVAACTPRTHEPLFRDTLRRRHQSMLLRHGEYLTLLWASEREAAARRRKTLSDVGGAGHARAAAGVLTRSTRLRW